MKKDLFLVVAIIFCIDAILGYSQVIYAQYNPTESGGGGYIDPTGVAPGDINMSSYDIFDTGNFYQTITASDIEPENTTIKGSNSYPEATGSNRNGGVAVVCGGAPVMTITFANYANCAGDIGSTRTMNRTGGTAFVTETEGVEWVGVAAGSNAVAATNLAAAFDLRAHLESYAVSNVVYITTANGYLYSYIDFSDASCAVDAAYIPGYALFSQGAMLAYEQKFFFDADMNTYIQLGGSDQFWFFVGGQVPLKLTASKVNTIKSLEVDGDLYIDDIRRASTATIGANDTTPLISSKTMYFTSDNSGATDITDLDSPTVNQDVHICIGGTGSNASTITAAGNFTLPGGNWTPSLGGCIHLFVIADNEYLELSRN